MKENKNKANIFDKRWILIGAVVVVSLIVITLIMNMIVPDENTQEQTLNIETWKEAEKEVSEYYDDGLNSVYNQEVQSVYSPTDNQSTADNTNDSEILAENEKKTEAGTEIEKNISTLLEKPVNGRILKDYSVDELVYSDTMQDWRVHTGIDFSAEDGEDVKAVADGVIESVTDSGMLGTCVTVAHSNGLKTVYGNLQRESASIVGTQVKTGDVIAKVGNTATLEIDELPHIHFEVILNNENVNPHDYMRDTVADDE